MTTIGLQCYRKGKTVPNVNITSSYGRLAKILGTGSTGFNDGYIENDKLSDLDGFFVLPTNMTFNNSQSFTGFGLPTFTKTGNRLSWVFSDEIKYKVSITFLYGGY